MYIVIFLTCICSFFVSQSYATVYDVVVYGGTSAGVMAAVQAAKMQKSVILVEPGKHLGGMTSNGLSYIDILNTSTIGGLCREYFFHVWMHYQNSSAWVWEPKTILPNQDGMPVIDEKVMWLLEPHIGERIFKLMIASEKVPVLFGERLDRENGVCKQNQNITHITMVSGTRIAGKVFIDATYEGDLMAAAGVSYTIGRESNQQYGETLNGVFVNRKTVPFPVDPYQKQGSPESGLLPRVYPFPAGLEGEGDSGVQAFAYRLCLTNIPQNRVPIDKPNDYDEKNYELVFRLIEAGDKKVFFKQSSLPNCKIDANSSGPVSMDFIGMSWSWAEADDVTRLQIAKEHEGWQRGLLWTLQNHPRIPEEIRISNLQWGLAKDEFVDNGHWPYQLYVREARRMVSDFVLTEAYAMREQKTDDTIGIASYRIDSHAVKYCLNDKGLLTTEGAIIGKPPLPFPISYRAIIPKREECSNLLVPVCLSASHIGFCGIRTEPIFMILGQSAGIAASLSIELDLPLHNLPYVILKQRLLEAKQVVDYPILH